MKYDMLARTRAGLQDLHGRSFNRTCSLTCRRETGVQYILTKGDNNQVDDRGLYNPGQLWIHRKDVVGKVRGYV